MSVAQAHVCSVLVQAEAVICDGSELPSQSLTTDLCAARRLVNSPSGIVQAAYYRYLPAPKRLVYLSGCFMSSEG